MQAFMRNRLVMTLLVTALLALTFGCENNSGSRGNNGGQSSPGFFISPAPVSLGALVNEIVLTITGGVAPFTWTVSEPTIGTVTGLDTNMQTQSRSVNYRRAAGAVPGINTVTVQDSQGNRATTTVDSNTDPQIKISPSVATLASNQLTQAFAVTGGTTPYTWSVSTPALGSITFVNNDMATYTRTAGAVGQNGIRVRDAAGFAASASVNQTN